VTAPARVPQAPGVAAWVAGEPVTVAEVEARLAVLRSSFFGTRLPAADTAEGRNARRWVTQLLCAERIVRNALAVHGITPRERPRQLRLNQALAVGGVTAAVLATIPELGLWASRWPLPIEEATIRDYYQRNPDLYADRDISYADARDQVASELHRAAVDRAIAAWLDQRLASDTVLADGFEHPASPANPDTAHRH